MVHIAGEGRLRRLTRNRPDKHKASTRAIGAEPGAALDTPCHLRVGAGRTVATGQDRSAAVGPNPAIQAENRREGYNWPIGRPIGPIARREKPVIAAGGNIARQGIGPAPGAP